jgi:hypothetical protein
MKRNRFYKTNPDSDFPVVPVGKLKNGLLRKTTECSAEEILGRIINKIENNGDLDDIKELILEWQHS